MTLNSIFPPESRLKFFFISYRLKIFFHFFEMPKRWQTSVSGTVYEEKYKILALITVAEPHSCVSGPG
jgi:hypothetical protein